MLLTMTFKVSCFYRYRGLLFFLSLLIFIFRFYFILHDKIVILEWVFLRFPNLKLYAPVILDKFGLLFSSVVLFISSNVLVFSNLYIEEEYFKIRFLYLVLLFIISINLLIFIPHFIGLLLGWDGLGLISFLLVIYYQNKKSLGAGMITALSNRVGDVFLLLSIGLRLTQGHWKVLFMWDSKYRGFIILIIRVAVITKRAQVPFSSWLPAAIAAPTPVSALVHSSTLVTAGVFLLIRFYPFLITWGMFNFLIILISCLTITLAGFRALVECDLKKIVALSTLSQLGVIIVSIGLGYPLLAFYHLITHALFKALMFICVGVIIHNHHHEQDLRSIGNLSVQLPFTVSCINIASLALCGLPFMSGFYSKDLIIELALYDNYNVVAVILFVLGTFCTAGYSVRLVLSRVLYINCSFNIQYLGGDHLDGLIPTFFLRVGGIFGGCVINWFFISPFSEPLVGGILKLSALSFTLLGALLFYLLTNLDFSVGKIYKLSHYINCHMWFLPPLSTQFILGNSLSLSKCRLSYIDQGWVELVGSETLFNFFYFISNKLRTIQRVYISHHLGLILFGVFFIPYFLGEVWYWFFEDVLD